jgi:hypothetical protein
MGYSEDLNATVGETRIAPGENPEPGQAEAPSQPAGDRLLGAAYAGAFLVPAVRFAVLAVTSR